MADTASTLIGAAHVPPKSPLGQPLDFDIRGLGHRLPRTEAPEAWLKKIARSREGKVWVGFFHLWTTDANGRRVRTKKEKTLGPAMTAKHEAQEKLTEYITEYTGRLTSQGNSITTFSELWKAFCAVKSGQWSKKTKENLQCLFGKHVVPIIGPQAPREVTLTSLQLLLNKMAEDIRACGRRERGSTVLKGRLAPCLKTRKGRGRVQPPRPAALFPVRPDLIHPGIASRVVAKRVAPALSNRNVK
jgi:hypothetical protein